MSTPSIAERVAAGVAWLDERWPSWADEIDLPGFSIGSSCGCVLGQLYGDYWDAPLVRRSGDSGAAARGFNTQDSRERPKLQAEWTRVIEERRQAAGEAS